MAEQLPDELQKNALVGKRVDALIIGGGPVGLLLAIGLARQGRHIALVERMPPKQSPSFDGRVLALSYGSKKILDALGVWSGLASCVTAIEHVHVSQKGYLGLTHLHADEMKVPALGYSITAFDLGNVLWKIAAEMPEIELYTESTLRTFEQTESTVSATVEQTGGKPQQFQTRLLIGADGTDSQVRKVLELPLKVKQYDAFGVIAKITSAEHPNGWAYERFTEEGPVALLPMAGQDHKAVMVVPEHQVDAVKAMSDEAFIEAFTEKMGARFGGFVAVSERVAYPLKETYVDQMVKGRVVLMGNASHTQHPVAAQGLNLGISDISDFLALSMSVEDLGNAEMLAAYEQQRHPEHEKIMGFTDGLIQVFQNSSAVVGHLRGLGLMAVEALPRLRKRLTKLGMGLAGK